MGVVNVTPDSFSDGGAWYDPDAAIAHGFELVEQGADIVDVGGESTRPGAQRVDAAEELRRIGPVVTALARAGVPVSIDTMRASTAEFAVAAGARLVNDVSGGLADPDMPRLVAAAGVAYVVMHWRGHSSDMYARAVYADVVREVRDELRRRVAELVKAGVHPDCLVLDPGLGFGKRPEHNWPLLAHLAELADLDGEVFPVLVGASRKRFIGKLLAAPDGTPRSFAGSDNATVATTALAAANGAWCVRVHQVPGNADAVRVSEAWAHASEAEGAVLSGLRSDEGATREDNTVKRPQLNEQVSTVIALGANLGDRLATLRQAVADIAALPGTEVAVASPVYQTAAVGGPAQPDYLNAVLIVRTGLTPAELLAALHGIEAAHGRVRDVRWGPRTLDLDIVVYQGQTSDDPELTLPHPRARERAFVLAPWHDIDPDALLGTEPVATLLGAATDRDTVRKLPTPLLIPDVG